MNLHFLVQREEHLSVITQKLAPTLASQQIIFVEGEMGSGKTTFTRYLIKTLSDINEVNFHFQGSPTYQRENHYHLKQVNLVHFDFYQVENQLNIDLEAGSIINIISSLEMMREVYLEDVTNIMKAKLDLLFNFFPRLFLWFLFCFRIRDS